MPEISLTKGCVALVDEEDYAKQMCFHWYAKIVGRRVYAARNDCKPGDDGLIKRVTLLLHREIMQAPAGVDVDHVDRNSLNNRRQNLRTCSRQQNCCNVSLRCDNTSGYKGVCWDKQRNRWRARIWVKEQCFDLGGYVDLMEAVLAYNQGALEYQGVFAYMNPLPQGVPDA